MIAKHYMKRLRAGLRPDTNSLVRYISEETFINLKPYSFKGHEYQQYFTELIENDPNVDISAEKCSQIGLSEIVYRIILALMDLNPGFSVALLMPSISFSNEVLKTRIAQIIEQSPRLKSILKHDIDSASMKMFQNQSILYALGASVNSKSTLINRPITLAVSDELDKLDYDVHTGLRSRQTHSIHKPRISISTPTAPGIGINAEAEDRQMHYQLMICPECKLEFAPDYFEQVEVPGFNDPITLLTPEKARTLALNTDLAVHFCPGCHAILSGKPIKMPWVIENQERRKIHVRLTPFSARDFISPADLVTSQLTFSSRTEFLNQSLGLPATLADSSIDISKIQFSNEETPSGVRVGGLDLGKVSHFMEGVTTETVLFVDVVRLLELGELEKEVDTAIRTHRLASMVSDAMPFLDLINRWSNRHPMLWPAYYVDPVKPMPEMYKLKSNTDERVRQISINKNLVFDSLAEALMSGQIVFRHSAYDHTITEHIQDFRRIRDHRYAELRYRWVKGKGNDHFFHALCYLFMASKLIRQSSNHSLSLPTSALFNTFKLKVDL